MNIKTKHNSQPQWRPFAKFTIFGTFLCLIVAYIYLYMTSPGTGGQYIAEVTIYYLLLGWTFNVILWLVLVVVTPIITLIVVSIAAALFRPRSYSSNYRVRLFISIIFSFLVTMTILTPLYQLTVCVNYLRICS